MALSRGGIFLKHELERGQFLYENVLEGSRFQHFTVWTTPPPPPPPFLGSNKRSVPKRVQSRQRNLKELSHGQNYTR